VDRRVRQTEAAGGVEDLEDRQHDTECESEAGPPRRADTGIALEQPTLTERDHRTAREHAVGCGTGHDLGHNGIERRDERRLAHGAPRDVPLVCTPIHTPPSERRTIVARPHQAEHTWGLAAPGAGP
jgi:hypothetical protein